MDNYKRAFSLLELLIVMGITAALIGIGFVSLTAFQDATELQRSYTEVSTTIQTLENRANNSIGSASKQAQGTTRAESIPDYYALIYNQNNNTLSPLYCDSVSQNQVACAVESDINVIEFQRDIEISLNNCVGLGFEIVTGNVVRLVDNASVVDEGLCTLTISHVGVSQPRSIIINADNNSVEQDER